MYTILSFDGGGIKGIISLKILQSIVNKISTKTISIDCIAGTSTGALIAIGLGLKKSISGLLDWYLQRGTEIFYLPWYKKLLPVGNLIKAKYDVSTLEACTKDFAGNAKLSDLAFDFIVPTSDLTNGSPCFWTKQSDNIEVWQLARMATAAPTYFDPYILDNNAYADGALFINNPAELALREANYNDPHDLILISIGTGKHPLLLPTDPTTDGGLLEWAVPISNTMIALGEEGAHKAVTKAFKKASNPNYFRLNPLLDHSIALDAASPDDIAQLLSIAEDFCQKNDSLLTLIANTLEGNKDGKKGIIG